MPTDSQPPVIDPDVPGAAPVDDSAGDPVEVVPSAAPDEPGRYLYKKDGVTYDFEPYDEVRYWQTDKRQQRCVLCMSGNPSNGDRVEIPVTNVQECIEIERAFHAVKPRVHQGHPW